MTTRSQTGTDPMGIVAALHKSGFGHLTGMGMAWVEAFSDMGVEFLGFLADRVKEDVKTQHKILHCRDMHELQHIQAEFVQRAIEDYQAETGKLVKMSAALLSNTSKKN